MKQANRWVTVVACSVLLGLSLGTFNGTNGIFVEPVCTSLGLSRGSYTFYRTIHMLLSGLTMPFYSKLSYKIGVKKVFFAGSIALFLSAFAFSACTKLWHVYASAFLWGISYNSVNLLTVGILINALFKENTGTALGISYAGAGIGGGLSVPLLNNVVAHLGWRWAYRIIGFSMLAMLPIIAFAVCNMEPDRQVNTNTAKSKGYGDILKRPATWYLMIAFFASGMITSVASTNSSSHLTVLGHPAAFAGSMMSIFLVGQSLGKLSLGILYDRLGIKAEYLLIITTGICGPALALLCKNSAVVWIYMIVIGIHGAAMSVPVSILSRRYYSSEEFPAAFSLFSMITIIGCAVAPPLAGSVFDVTGSYSLAWIGLTVLAVMMSSFFLIVERKLQKNELIPHS